MNRRRGLRRHGATLGLTGAMIALVVSCSRPSPPPPSSERPTPGPATYVGVASCADCHENETDRWRGSHHDLAMQTATEETVLGSFDDTAIVVSGVETSFFRRDGGYWVRTDGVDGTPAEFEIVATFGAVPLQQYLVDMGSGRWQALPIAWDTRPEATGGQRWFHLYPDESILAGDPLHWTGLQQNWNHMCADCHSTHLVKGYDEQTDSFDTTWAEIDVACEACHGPGSRHVAWAEARERGAPWEDLDFGLELRLKDTNGGTWSFESGEPIATRTRPLASRIEIETCAPCHSRRGQIAESGPGEPFLDAYRPSLLRDELYFPDGQIRDEVYVWGSFRQSRMYEAGVTCSDCHDPHSLEVVGGPDAACSRCHEPSVFDSSEHHHHPVESTGTSCVACHMPSRDYMVIDPRRDHSFKVPRPDLAEVGVPNVCRTCHEDRDDTWAAETMDLWYGPSWRERAETATALHAARSSRPEGRAALLAALADPDLPAIARATVVGELGESIGPSTFPAVQAALNDPDPIVRMGAVLALESADPRAVVTLLAPVLSDPARVVRTEAARILAAMPLDGFPNERLPAFESALSEYRDTQDLNADRADARLNRGVLAVQMQQFDLAESEYLRAIELVPHEPAPVINLSDLYRELGREAEGENLLRDALGRLPDSAELHYAMGLLLVRSHQYDDALEELRRATELAPDQAGFAYVYAVALQSTERAPEALAVLDAATSRLPGNIDLLLLQASLHRDRGEIDAARRAVERALAIDPNEPTARGLARSLESP